MHAVPQSEKAKNVIRMGAPESPFLRTRMNFKHWKHTNARKQWLYYFALVSSVVNQCLSCHVHCHRPVSRLIDVMFKESLKVSHIRAVPPALRFQFTLVSRMATKATSTFPLLRHATYCSSLSHTTVPTEEFRSVGLHTETDEFSYP